jgi:flagellar biosynthesis protein FliP
VVFSKDYKMDINTELSGMLFNNMPLMKLFNKDAYKDAFKDYCDKAIERQEAKSLEELLKHKMIHHVAEYYQSMKGVDE